MLDIKFIRENKEAVAKAIKNKGIGLDLDELLKIDGQRIGLIQKSDELRASRNEIAAQMKSGRDEKLIEQGKKIKEELGELENQLKEIEGKYRELMLRVPNIPSADTPIGKDDNENKEIYRWGEPRKFDFEPKDHIQLGNDLDLIDTERGTKVAGFRGYYLKNELAVLHLGLLFYAFRKLAEKGFINMITPTIVRELALLTSGHFPGDRQEIYEVAEPDDKGDKETKYLAGTSEPSLLAYHYDEILDEGQLPLKYAGFSPCYRKEIGGYGKDTYGIYRVHEFLKIEQVVFCRNDIEQSHRLFEEVGQNQKELFEELKLPYRILQICTGDMGAGKYEMRDMECWMPSRNSYGEAGSNSNLTDWQARRGNLRYRTHDGEIKYCHTLNNTMVAPPRIFIAILENYQNKDGSIDVPEVLQPLVGFKNITSKK